MSCSIYMSPPQVFLSYRTRRAAEVAPLLKALADVGVTVWRDEARIDEGASVTAEVLAGLSGAQVLLAWYSEDYPESRICQWEQALAWIAAEEVGSPHQRVFLLLPPDVQKVDHVLGLAKDQKAWRVPAAGPELACFARKLADRIKELDGRTLGELAPLAKPPRWLLRAQPHPSERFTGRAKDIWALHGHLHQDRAAVITGSTGPSTAQVRGLGGIGKTLLAVEYAARFGAAFPGGICWIDTAGRTSDGVLAELAIVLGLPPDAPARLKAALMELGSYLWMVDNLPVGLTQKGVEAWCAPTPNGRTLVTTRSRTWEALGKALDLGVLAPDEAFLLLTKRRVPSGDAEKNAAVELGKLVGYHPLTLDVLGALVNRHPSQEPYAAWLERLDESGEDALTLAQELKEELPTGAERYIGVVLQTSLDGLEPEAMDLLRLSVSLAEAPIPSELAVRVFHELEHERDCEDCWMLGVDAGQARSLLDTTSDPVPGYTVHPLVRRVFAYSPKEQERIAALRGVAVVAVRALLEGSEDVRNHARISTVVPHAENLLGEVATEDEAALVVRIAEFHRASGTYQEAKVHWERALEATSRLFGPEHPDTLLTKQSYAATLYSQGYLADARSIEETALEATTRVLGPEDPRTLIAQHNLSMILAGQGDLSGARSIQTQALEASTRLFGSEGPLTLAVQRGFANILYAEEDLAGARKHFEQALKTQTRLLGPQHLETLATLQNLAVTLYVQGDRAGARSHFERALEYLKQLLGPEHPDTLTTQQNLAKALRDLGDLAGARRLGEQVLEARTRLLGPEDPETLGTRLSVARTLYCLEDYAGARNLEETTLEAMTRVLGPEHPDTLTAQKNLAVSLLAQGELAGARSLYERVLKARTRLLGPEHPDTLTAQKYLAQILEAEREFASRSLKDGDNVR
jgi:tetratricopeptide (TPR) repeat protein